MRFQLAGVYEKVDQSELSPACFRFLLVAASLLSAPGLGQEVYPAGPFPLAAPYPYPPAAIPPPPGYPLYAVNEADLAAAKALGLGGGLELGPIGRRFMICKKENLDPGIYSNDFSTGGHFSLH
jgi:hypothetical protein